MQYCSCSPRSGAGALLAQQRTLLFSVLAMPLFDVLQIVLRALSCGHLENLQPACMLSLTRCIHSRECSEHISAHPYLLLLCVAQ